MGEPLPLRGAKGAIGFIRWQYMIASGVSDYVIVFDRARGRWTMRGGLVAPDAFKLGQTPLVFVVPTQGGGSLRWPVVTMTIRDQKISAILGAPA